MLGLFENEGVKLAIFGIINSSHWPNIRDIKAKLSPLQRICVNDCIRALIRERKIVLSRGQGYVIFNGPAIFRTATPDEECRWCHKPYQPNCCKEADNVF
jgi:hypothetical protein